jgi:hypothetical protein
MSIYSYLFTALLFNYFPNLILAWTIEELLWFEKFNSPFFMLWEKPFVCKFVKEHYKGKRLQKSRTCTLTKSPKSVKFENTM